MLYLDPKNSTHYHQAWRKGSAFSFPFWPSVDISFVNLIRHFFSSYNHTPVSFVYPWQFMSGPRMGGLCICFDTDPFVGPLQGKPLFCYNFNYPHEELSNRRRFDQLVRSSNYLTVETLVTLREAHTGTEKKIERRVGNKLISMRNLFVMKSLFRMHVSVTPEQAYNHKIRSLIFLDHLSVGASEGKQPIPKTHSS